MKQEIIKYLLYKFYFDGEPITNLKLQKVLYFVYVSCLMNKGANCFGEEFQAWALGPVLPSAYKHFESYGASTINPKREMGLKSREELDTLKAQLGDLVELIDDVYEEYGVKSAFELVQLTHSDPAWVKARGALGPGDRGNTVIEDEDVLKAYSE